MAITFTGSKTVTLGVSPTLTAAALTSLLAIAPEAMTVAQLHQITDALNRVSGGNVDSAVVGTLLV